MPLAFGENLFGRRDVRETPAGSSSSTSSTSIIAPIGSIMAWLKSFTNTPQTLPTGWMEADGSAISDADSVYDGQNAPDLNGSEFIRGAATSGGTGGGTTGAGSAHTHAETLGTGNESSHTHTMVAGDDVPSGSNFNLTTSSGSSHNHSITGSITNESSHTHSSAPKYYDVVWIFRFK